MSKTTVRSIHCDRCFAWCDGGDPLDTFEQMRRKLKKRGWRVKLPGVPGGMDLCPNCPD